MKEESAYCFYCECLKAADNGVVHVQIAHIQSAHAGEAVYSISVQMGGDVEICKAFAAMVEKHVQEALGVNHCIDVTPGSSSKPN